MYVMQKDQYFLFEFAMAQRRRRLNVQGLDGAGNSSGIGSGRNALDGMPAANGLSSKQLLASMSSRRLGLTSSTTRM
jgi:hypothetical protein